MNEQLKDGNNINEKPVQLSGSSLNEIWRDSKR